MIYGYLRVSSDEQDVNSQRQGVDGFATKREWKIDKYITDEGVSGAKDPSKRNLGTLLKDVKEGDTIIVSEISRLGRDLFIVMEILHICMQRNVKVFSVKDGYELGDNIQSKVLAFAFGLAAEIERQMIRQRTKEGLRLRMRMGVLCGRPPGRMTDDEALKYAAWKDRVAQMYEWKMSSRQIAAVVGCDRNTVCRMVARWGLKGGSFEGMDLLRERKKNKAKKEEERYKDEKYKVVSLDRPLVLELIRQDLTLPEITERLGAYTYEQVYDTFMCDYEFNTEYRQHGQKKCKSQRVRSLHS